MDGSDVGLKHAPNPSKEVEDIRKRPGEEPSLLPGDLGYRTRLVYPGLWYSGLDPLDTACESGRLLGLFLRKLFGGQIRDAQPGSVGSHGRPGAVGGLSSGLRGLRVRCSRIRGYTLAPVPVDVPHAFGGDWLHTAPVCRAERNAQSIGQPQTKGTTWTRPSPTAPRPLSLTRSWPWNASPMAWTMPPGAFSSMSALILKPAGGPSLMRGTARRWGSSSASCIGAQETRA